MPRDPNKPLSPLQREKSRADQYRIVLLEERKRAAGMMQALKKFWRADRELYRAENAGEQPRLNKAGTSYAIAKIRLFKHLR